MKIHRNRPPRNKIKTSASELTFFIDAMDALGQGVCKQSSQITFIAKTLPGESGKATLRSQKKGVRFAGLKTLEQAADNRIEPACPHFAECPGCAYLHTDYDSELAYKQAALQHQLHGLPDVPDIMLDAAPQRLHYRNRVQLHYRHKYIGILDGDSDRILEVPHCQLPQPALQAAIDALYQQKDWSKIHTGQGHCEIALVDGEVQQTWNEAYAHGGFTQVYDVMNALLRDRVNDAVKTTGAATLLDLFSGNGNLSEDSVKQLDMRRVMVDMTDYQHPDFIRLNLFDDDALKRFRKLNPLKKFDIFLLDPPRKGFSALAEWVAVFKPGWLVYVSCNAATMARDLKSLQGAFHIEHIRLLDMFPATKHFETLVLVKLKSS